ncbi:uncharacterized protein [Procambarus clarkii]|uniref:uncharacterized protein n=1 Tax=Procambarus clarkii TaxID=6728 RepID=UPI0037440FE1
MATTPNCRSGQVTRLHRTAAQIKKCEDLSQQSPVDYADLESYYQATAGKFEQVKYQIATYVAEIASTNLSETEIGDIMVDLPIYEGHIQATLQPFVYIIAQNKATTTTVSSNVSQAEARLPPINLSTFSGKDEEDWDEFWNKFVDIVDSQHPLPKNSKFSYLQGQLSGKAKTVVCHLRLTNDGCDLAVQLLNDNYADSEVRTSHLVHELLPSLL